MLSSQQILKKYWHYDNFRPFQLEIIENVLAKKNTLALLPTGGGKSICFQIPALILPGVCLVVSPLIALMKDQVSQLKQRDISAEAIYMGISKFEIDRILDACIYGKIKFLYISPERLKTNLFKERLKQMEVSLLAIDEAHCISKWGYDFRPAYLTISSIKELLPNIPTIALTATATNLVRQDIIDKLELTKCQVFTQSFARNNLSYSVFESEQKDLKVVDILKKTMGSSIVYAKTRKRTAEIAKELAKNNISADFYHAGLTIKERNQKQENWISDKKRVMVATNAFGMGIDKANVRIVIHTDLPENLEAYYQESGRAGRDNQKAYAICLFNELDIENLEKNLEKKYPPMPVIRKTYQSLCNYFQLAKGSITEQNFDFSMYQFCSNFGLMVQETFFALKILENQGLIYLNDAFFRPSTLKVITNSKGYFDFQERNENYSEFSKIILRIYGGEIFSNFVNISEQEIANAVLKTYDQTIECLEFMHYHKMIHYERQKNMPQLMFLTEIQDADHLSINQKELASRKANEKSALLRMKQYVSQEAKCRMQFIQDYFDEENTKKCGICDVCLNEKRLGLNSDLATSYEEKVRELLPCTLVQINENVFFEDRNLLLQVLEHKFKIGEFQIDSLGLIYLKY